MREAARRLLKDAGRDGAELSVLFVNDAGIRTLNRSWRGIDKPTDVLSWPQEVSPDGHAGDVPDVLGDVAISVDTAARQARARGWSEEEEVTLLLVHGILHLLGHEDETEVGAAEMRRIERRILGKPLEKVAPPSETDPAAPGGAPGA